jgi:hypothetical protein
VELYRATGEPAYEAAAAELGQELLSLQTREFIGSQKMIRGFWRAAPDDPNPYADFVYSALPPLALMELALAFPRHADATRWREAVRLHLDEYVMPLSTRSPYRIIPYGVSPGPRVWRDFVYAPTQVYYRPLVGELTYRFFHLHHSTTAHMECYAILLAMAAKAFGRPEYRDLAYRQLEWVMGANPFGACLMTGEGMRNPYPHSRFVGLIPGGIMPGMAGNSRDEPLLDTEYGFYSRTCEYFSPFNAFYVWALSLLESA